jgi:hypothetical protein
LCNNPAKVFEGAGSCLVELFRDSGFVDFQMIDPVSLPQGGANVFMEINYKTKTIKAVKTNKNPFTDKQNFALSIQFSFYKIIAFLTYNALKIIYKIGFYKKTFERIFGKEFLVE